MALSSEVRRSDLYTGDGTTTVFSFGFALLKTTDLKVVTATEVNAKEEAELESSEYAVTLNSDQDNNPGGKVTLRAPLAPGAVLRIISDEPYLQPSVFTNRGGFYPDQLNTALDRLTIQTQQLCDDVARCVKTLNTETMSADELRSKLLQSLDSAEAMKPYLKEIQAIFNDFSGYTEAHFDHDFGEWGVDDTARTMPVGGVLPTIAENIDAIKKVASSLNTIEDQGDKINPVAINIDSVINVSDNMDFIKQVAQTTQLDVAANGLETGAAPTVKKEVVDGKYLITFGLPAGPKGDKGDTGDKGDKGDTGPVGPAGSLATVKVEAVALAAGAEPTISQTDSVLTLGIPKGDKGDAGPQGKTGSTGPQGEDGFSPTVSIVGNILTVTDKTGGHTYELPASNNSSTPVMTVGVSSPEAVEQIQSPDVEIVLGDQNAN